MCEKRRKGQRRIKRVSGVSAWVYLSLVLLVFFQALIFTRISLRYRSHFHVTQAEIKKAVKSVIITTIGSALSIFIVGLALITQIGAPLSLSRLSVVGIIITIALYITEWFRETASPLPPCLYFIIWLREVPQKNYAVDKT